MTYIYLDESGQFAKKDHEKYFIVASFTVGDPRRTEKRFKAWQKNKFPTPLCHQSEVKFSEVKISNDLRAKTLKYISDLDVRIHYTFIQRNNIPSEYFKNDKIKSGHLYTQIISDTLELYLPTNSHEFRVFCDQRQLKGIKRSDFKQILKVNMLPKLPKDALVQIDMIDSTTNANIQIVDWIAGAIARYYENKLFGKEYFTILKNNFINEGKELFKKHKNYK